MNVMAVSLVAQTLPFAGVVIGDRENRWADLFSAVYFSAVGLLLSAVSLADDLARLP